MDAPARETGLASRSDGEQPVVEPLQPAPRRRRGRGRLELEAVTVTSMNELKRSGVVDGRYGFAKDQARCVWTTGRTALSARWTFPYPEVLAMDQLLSGRRVLVVED